MSAVTVRIYLGETRCSVTAPAPAIWSRKRGQRGEACLTWSRRARSAVSRETSLWSRRTYEPAWLCRLMPIPKSPPKTQT